MSVASVSSPLQQYLGEVWEYRHFWLSLVRIDLRNRYKRSVLGIGWSMMHPIAMTTVLCYAFHAIFNITLSEYVPFLMTGIAFWTFISGATTDGCQAFYLAQGFIRSKRLPLAIYPLRAVLGTTLHFSIVLLLTIAIAAVFKGYDRILPLLSLIPTLCILMMLGWSIAVIMAFACVNFPDVQHLSTIGLQILFYLTPVMYPESIVLSRGFGNVLKYNPLGQFVGLIRDPIVNSQFPSLTAYAIALGLTAVMGLLAILTLRRCERTLIFALI